MKLKWVIGRKTNYFITTLWAFCAVVDFIQGDWQLGMLEALLAINALTDAFRGEEVPVLDFKIKIGKEAK
jgi:hypothetical protein